MLLLFNFLKKQLKKIVCCIKKLQLCRPLQKEVLFFEKNMNNKTMF